MVHHFNSLLDSGCTRHVVRDRALFRDYAQMPVSLSVGTATCGPLDALGSGDVEFHYPFGDRCIIFTLHGCLYAPTAPVNLLSVRVLMARGLSCLFSNGGITKVSYPDSHLNLPGLTFSPTVVNHLSYLLLDFIPPVASSAPVHFPPWVSRKLSPPVPGSVQIPSSQVSFPSSPLSSRSQPKSPPKKTPSFSNPNYLVIDTTLPSHIFNDRSLFTTYTPGSKVHRTAFGHDTFIEGTGEVNIRVLVAGQYICFRMQNCWHVPSSPHHFLSCSAAVSLGHQVMIAGRSPRLIYSPKRRLDKPTLPKYIPFTSLHGFLVLEFSIPSPTHVPIPSQPASPGTQSTTIAPTFLSLQASYHPFAGLAFDRNHLPTNVMPDTSTRVGVAGVLRGGAHASSSAASALVGFDACSRLDDDANQDVMSHGGADAQLLMPVDVTVDGPGIVDEDAGDHSSLDSFDTGSLLFRASTRYHHHYFPSSCASSLSSNLNWHTNTTCFSQSS
jgi:hypothetical protein